jgi:hypothetical protein
MMVLWIDKARAREALSELVPNAILTASDLDTGAVEGQQLDHGCNVSLARRAFSGKCCAKLGRDVALEDRDKQSKVDLRYPESAQQGQQLFAGPNLRN